VEFSLAHVAQVNRNLDVLLEAQSWLLPGRPLGIALGDRLWGCQGASGLFEAGCGWHRNYGSSRENL
jgi:hypothetical protein